MKGAAGLFALAGSAALVLAALDIPIGYAQNAPDARNRGDRFRHRGGLDDEATPRRVMPGEERIREAPTGFDNLTNGFDPQGPALGNKTIHPYSDFLMHDIGTSDGIPVLPDAAFASTANQMRTAPLWAMRTRNRLMHDGLSFTKQEAIARHAGQAAAVTARHNALSPDQQRQLLAFLDSL